MPKLWQQEFVLPSPCRYWRLTPLGQLGFEQTCVYSDILCAPCEGGTKLPMRLAKTRSNIAAAEMGRANQRYGQ
jgi:hypothetical protein